MKKQMHKILMIFLVMNLVGLAVALFLASGLGSDSIGLLCDGISHFFHIRFGNASLIYNLIIIILAFLLARNNLGLGSISYALISGYFIDLYSFFLAPFHLSTCVFLIRFGSFLIGQCCLSLGLALLIHLELGMNALDALIYKIETITKIPYAIIRTGCDCSYVILGALLGGTFGMGTIISVLSTGTMVKGIDMLLNRR